MDNDEASSSSQYDCKRQCETADVNIYTCRMARNNNGDGQDFTAGKTDVDNTEEF